MAIKLFKNLVPKLLSKADSLDIVMRFNALLDDLLTATIDVPDVDTSGGGGATPTGSFVTAVTEPSLVKSRLLTAGAGVTVTDGGPLGPITIAATGSGAPVNASYLTLGLDPTLTNERVLTAGNGVSFIDTGPNGTLTISTSGVGTFFYGDGSDGALHFDGSSTVAGLVPAANVYTMTANLYATSIIIDVGVTVKSQNFNVFCQGDCQINGSLGAPGNASAGGTSGAGGVGITGAFWQGSQAGATGAAAGSGVNTANVTTSLGNANVGQAGHGSGVNVGGTSSVTPPATTQGGIHIASVLAFAQLGAVRSGTIFLQMAGGSGGASGGGGGGTSSSGGGGAAGMLMLASDTISGNGTINMKGGTSTQSTSVNVGGSNGGGGGILFVVTATTNYASLLTVDVSGGTKSLTTGSGAPWTDGQDGGVGRIFNFFTTP